MKKESKKLKITISCHHLIATIRFLNLSLPKTCQQAAVQEVAWLSAVHLMKKAKVRACLLHPEKFFSLNIIDILNHIRYQPLFDDAVPVILNIAKL